MSLTKNIFLSVKKNWFIALSLAVYIFFCLFYMGPSVTSCTTTTYGFGDNTAGPIWRATLQNQAVYGSQTDITNYPYGDQLRSPVNDLFLLQMPLIKSFQAVAGPVCGYNLLNIFSFILSSLMMFGFVLFLTRNKWIALFSGFAVAFTPYYQMKVGGHPTYGLQAVFIGLMWLFFRLLKYRRKRDAVYLGLAWIFALYLDPYFSIISAIVMLGLFAAWVIVNRKLFVRSNWSNKIFRREKSELKLLAIAVGVMLAVSVPLLSMYALSNSQITGDVAAARGNVLAEAKACSNWPHEYVVPFVLHPLFKDLFGDDRYQRAVDGMKQDFSCGIGEDTVGLSITLVILVVIGLIVIGWDRLNGRRIGLSKVLQIDGRIVVLSLLLIGLIAVVMALPPVRFKGVIPTPSYELLEITSTWRTLTRFYMLVNIALIGLASVLFAYIWKKFPKKKNLLIAMFVVVWGLVIIEYQAFMPFTGNAMSTFNYTKDAPDMYQWIRDQKDIKVIAEYPLEQYGKESDAMSYYLSMQPIHGKKLYNSALSNGRQEKYKDSLKNLADPQTLRVLKSQGVDTVLAHGVSEKRMRELFGSMVVYTADPAKFSLSNHSPVVKSDNTVILSLSNVSPLTYYIDLDDGFARNVTIINSIVDWKYEAVSGSKFAVRGIANKEFTENTQPVGICFSAQMSLSKDDDTTLTAVIDGDQRVDLGIITGDFKPYKVTASKSVKLVTGNGHNMRVSRLGCADE